MNVDKNGQLGIWDARAPPDEVADEDGVISTSNKEEGKYWHLQCHWPATAKSSISCIKLDPVDAHGVRDQPFLDKCTLTTVLRYLRLHMTAPSAAYLSSRGFRRRYSLQVKTSSPV